MSLTLVIGNKNYSSWSFRPWIAMKAAGIPFDEVIIPLFEPGSAERIRSYSPAGKVPILIEGDTQVWESLAIIEHLAERHPDAGLWPGEPRARAHARAVSAEMHAGFAPLRRACPMNMWRLQKPAVLDVEVQANVRRIDEIWTDCRRRFGGSGPYLFGDGFSGADAMYAPVVSRFLTYGIGVGDVSRQYMEAVALMPAWREWRNAALNETWVMPNNEQDWPVVPRVQPVAL